MGTNYYLIRKMKYTKGTPASLGCEHSPCEVQELLNGYVLRGVYYPTLKKLNKHFTQEIHIGKASCGWHFSLCIYPQYGINNYADWEKLLLDPNNEIYDEYDDPVKPEDMIRTITQRTCKREWSNDPVQRQAEEAYARANHAELGNNGLLRHARDKYHVDNPDKTATYDYVISGNDPEEGCIFC